MIIVTIEKDNGAITSVEGVGHSGYAPAGEDVVCAGVSALIQALALGMSDIAKVESTKIEIDTQRTRIKVSWPRSDKREILLLAETVVRSLENISKSYKGYVKIVEVRK